MLNNKTPLWMPNGSVRALLALVVVVPFTVLALTSGATLTSDQIVGIITMVIGAYFVQKAAAGSGNG